MDIPVKPEPSKGAKVQMAVAAMIAARVESQQVGKGKKRDAMALELLLGASAAASVIAGPQSPEYSALSALAFLVSCRGYSAIERVNQGGEAQS